MPVNLKEKFINVFKGKEINPDSFDIKFELEVLPTKEEKKVDDIFYFEANEIIKNAKEFNLPVLRPRVSLTGSSFASQAGIITAFKRILKADLKNYIICFECDKVFGYPELITPSFTRLFVDQPDTALAIADGRINEAFDFAKNLFGRLEDKGIDLEMVTMCSDIYHTEGAYQPDWVMDRFVFPYLKKQVEFFRKAGIKYIVKHTDGNILVRDKDGVSALEKIINCGIDAFHPVDPVALDIKEVKEEIKKINPEKPVCLLGGIDLSEIVSHTDEDFDRHARYCLKHGFAGGGYIPGSSSMVGGKPIERKRYKMLIEILKSHSYLG